MATLTSGSPKSALWDSLKPDHDTERVVANSQLLFSSKNLEALSYCGVSNTKHFVLEKLPDSLKLQKKYRARDILSC
jgi:hypothetical protein